MQMLKVFVLSLLLWGSPVLADESVSFDTSNAGVVLGKIKGLNAEVDFFKSEINLLVKKNTELSLSSGYMNKLNLNYKGAIADLEGDIELLESEVSSCEYMADQWKDEAVECGEDLIDARTVPWYLSMRLWLPISFVAGVYTGASTK